MPGMVIGKSLLRGFFGNVARSIDTIIEASQNKEATAPIAFGAPVVLKSDGTGVINWASTNVAADFAGIAVREVKTETVYGSNVAQYDANDVMDVLKRGSVIVKCVKDATATNDPVKGGVVYIRKATGEFVAAAEGTSGADTVALDNVVWGQNGVDANGAAELVILKRVK